MQCQFVVIGAKIVVPAAARALTLEGFIAAHDTVAVLDLVRPKAGAHGAALGDSHADLLTFAAQPTRWVDGRAAVPDLEMQVWRKIGVGDPDSPDLRAFLDRFMEPHVRPRERSVDRLVAAAMFDDDRRAVRT